MKSQSLKLLHLPMIAVLVPAFITGCATLNKRIGLAASTEENSRQIHYIIEDAEAEKASIRRRAIDAMTLPKKCGLPEKSGVKVGDRESSALVKTDRALSRANSKGASCANQINEAKKVFERNVL